MKCKICNSNINLFIKDIFDDRYGYPKLFDIYKCKKCESFITNPPLSMAEIGPLYTDFYPRKDIILENILNRGKNFKKESILKQWFSGEHRIHRRLPIVAGSGIKILDIGCGDGSSLLELQSMGYEAYGIETDSNIEKIRIPLNLNIFIGTVEDAPFQEHSFDFIMANQVIEHVVDLDSFMINIKKLLKPNGAILMSTPNAKSIFRKIYGRSWIHWHIPYHQQILSKKSMYFLSQKNGLNVRLTKTISPSSWTVHEINRMRFSPKLGQKNPFWVNQSSIKSSVMGKIFRKIVFIKMSIIGKIADIFGQGNCLISHLEIKK